MNHVSRAVLFAGLACASPLHAADLKVPLVFQPQESVATTELPSLPPSILDRPIALVVIDARGETSNRIGQGTDDDDATFSFVAAQPIAPFVQSVVTELAKGNGVRLDAAAPLQLKTRLTAFTIEESNKAVGSMYGGVVKFAYTLESAGKLLAEGAAEGSARRYGKSASVENVAEVLSDATKQAFANVLADPRLQHAWRTGMAVMETKGSDESVESRLERLDALLDSGKISPEEHKQARAKVLSDI